jgi:ketosteroid isomerase-like protein
MKTHLKMTMLTACCLALLVSACTQQHPDTRATDERAIRDADSAWSAASAAKDLDRYLFYFAPEASIFATPGNMSSKTAKVDVSRGGDFGYSSGTYEYTFKDAKGKPVIDRGKYLTVWKKQPDGNWKAVADIYNSDLPVTPPPSK